MNWDEWVSPSSKEKAKLERAIQNIHDEHPDAIFLTHTSAVPFGWAIREAWKKAYPDEPVPKMLTIDVGQLKYSRGKGRTYGDIESLNESKFWKDEKSLKKDPEFLREVKSLEGKIQKYHIKKFVVFDESTSEYGQTDYRDHGKFAGTGAYPPRPRATLFLVDRVISKAHEDLKGSFESGMMYGINDWSHGGNIGASGPYAKAQDLRGPYGAKPRLRWRHARKPKAYNPRVKGNIEYMKQVGREIGEEIAGKKKIKKVALESLAIILFLGLGIAYQMPFTGYAVNSLVAASKQSYPLAASIPILCILTLSALWYLNKRK